MPRGGYRGWGVDTAAFELLIGHFRDVPRKLQPAIRSAVSDAASGLVDAIRGDASWSSRIPAAVRTRTSFAARGSGIRVYVDSTQAPHARPYEGLTSGGNRGSFRHPVFGDREVWVSQATRPFFRKNVEKHREKVLEAIEIALMQTLPRR